MDTKRCAIYTRVSTDEQAKEGYSLEAQEERLAELAISKEWIVAEVYCDDGYSAKNMNRPALARMMTDARLGKFENVLIYKIDRLSRSLKDLIEIVSELAKLKIGFKSSSEFIDTTTAEGRLVFHQFGSFAQYERELISQRVKMAMMKKLRKGEWNALPPLGYLIVEKKLVIHEPEAQVIRLIFDLFLNKNMGITTIARELNRRNIQLKKTMKWRGNRIYKLITNPVYTGVVRWGGDEAQGIHQPIIDRALFDSVQNRLKYKKKDPRRFQSPNFLSGLVTCGCCGSAMSVTYPGKKDQFKYYACQNRLTTKECQQGYIRVDILEKSVVRQIGRLAKEPKIIETLVNDFLEHSRNKVRVLQDRQAEINQKMVEIQRRKEEVADAVVFRKPDAEMYKVLNERAKVVVKEHDMLNRELWQIESKIQDYQLRNYSVKGISDFLSVFTKTFDDLEPGQKKLVVECLVSEVKIGRNKDVEFVFTPPYDGLGVFNPLCVPKGLSTPKDFRFRFQYMLAEYCEDFNDDAVLRSKHSLNNFVLQAS